ncbi:MAG TPA: DUF3343 domain-containing protein [Anaerolineales bacterium]|jgi:hypothetical protein|nr:DUF3343 domain-containing protein [Anaerolineales bacterium]
MSAEYAVILVDSTSHALRIEKLLNGQGLTCKLIPVPRHLSSDCGVCVRILKQDLPTVEILLNEHQIAFQSIEGL